uniref:Uncharacterized protein n=1 Tax=Cacopsylla melanoneura TaxID=428564 RepID=A0A8D9E8Z5_9HEMI
MNATRRESYNAFFSSSYHCHKDGYTLQFLYERRTGVMYILFLMTFSSPFSLSLSFSFFAFSFLFLFLFLLRLLVLLLILRPFPPPIPSFPPPLPLPSCSNSSLFCPPLLCPSSAV